MLGNIPYMTEFENQKIYMQGFICERKNQTILHMIYANGLQNGFNRAVVLGTCSGGACCGPALCDFIFTVKNISKMFITGPNVIKSVTYENVTMDELGVTSFVINH